MYDGRRGARYGTFCVFGAVRHTSQHYGAVSTYWRLNEIMCVSVCWIHNKKQYLLTPPVLMCLRAGSRALNRCAKMILFLCEDARLDWLLSGSDFSRFFRAEPQLLIISCRKPHFKGAFLFGHSKTLTRFVLLPNFSAVCTWFGQSAEGAVYFCSLYCSDCWCVFFMHFMVQWRSCWFIQI